MYPRLYNLRGDVHIPCALVYEAAVGFLLTLFVFIELHDTPGHNAPREAVDAADHEQLPVESFRFCRCLSTSLFSLTHSASYSIPLLSLQSSWSRVARVHTFTFCIDPGPGPAHTAPLKNVLILLNYPMLIFFACVYTPYSHL